MRTLLCLSFIGLLMTAPRATNAAALNIGPEVGWSVRQVALVPQELPQVDLLYHYVTFGVLADAVVVDELFFVRVRGALDMMEHMEISGVPQPGTFSQHSMTFEAMPVLSFFVTDNTGISVGTGVSFTHYLPNEIRGSFQDEVKGVPEQQMVQIPLMLGARIETESIVFLPELGVGYAIYYDSLAPDVKEGLEDGSVTVQNLDFWFRVGLAFPVL